MPVLERVGAEDSVVQLIAGVGQSGGVEDVAPLLDRLRMTEAQRVERRFGERDAEVGVDGPPKVRRVVANAANATRLGVGDEVVASRRHVVTRRRRPGARRPVAAVGTHQHQQQRKSDGDKHLSTTPPPRCRQSHVARYPTPPESPSSAALRMRRCRSTDFRFSGSPRKRSVTITT